MRIISSSEEEANPVKGHTFKEKQEKAKTVQKMTDNKMAERKVTTKEKKDEESKAKGTKDWKEDKVSGNDLV